jgi:hypothetical protein
MVSFNVSDFSFDDRPYHVGVDIIYTANELQESDISISRLIAGVIKDVVITRVSQFNSWSRQRTLERTVGGLNAISNANSKTYDEIVRLVDIDYNFILGVFEKIGESNDTLLITDLSWGYDIDPRSITEGGAANFPLPSWVCSRNYRSTWESHDYNGQIINCAAFALQTYISKIFFGIRSKSEELKSAAYELQLKFNWGAFTTFSELEVFVEAYPEYKLCIILPPVENCLYVYTGENYRYYADHPESNIIYLFYHDDRKTGFKHYALIKTPMNYWRGRPDRKWCHFCNIKFKLHEGHECENHNVVAKHQKSIILPCELCGRNYVKRKKNSHVCFGTNCQSCFINFVSTKEKPFYHRCPLIYKTKKAESDYVFLVYDLESRFESIKTEREVITSFKMDENGYYVQEEPETAAIYENTIDVHHANLVCVKDINTNEEWNFKGENCLQDFLIFCFSHNKGKCVLLAHNSSGYDARLLFDTAKHFVKEEDIRVILRGSKILELGAGKLVFRDIMLHIPGSVKGLAKDFNCKARKGDFPFMFNRLENYNYNGPIPGLEYFSLQNCRNDKDREELLKWHSEFKGDWNFQEQILAYCRNDVAVSTEIAKAYHDVWFDKGILPWLKPTGPGVVNLYMGILAWEQFCDKNNRPSDIKWETKENYEWLQKTDFKKTWWTVCTPFEHFFAKAALRGGRTEVRRMYYKLTDEDRMKGRKILYVDVCSMYPYQQIVHDFPVGVPTIYFFGNEEFAGCNHHFRKLKCDCPFYTRTLSSHFYSFKKLDEMPDISTWFGFVCVTLKPPKNLLHPLIVYFDEEKVKCISSLRDSDHVEIVIGTNTFQMCLKHGYEIIKVN